MSTDTDRHAKRRFDPKESLMPAANASTRQHQVHRIAAVLFATLVSIQLLVTGDTACAADIPSRPNIVIILADDMGYGDLSIQNPDSKIPTPHLDRLAQEGLRCTNGHSSSGICTPSRYALLTGRYHWRKFHGIVQAFGPSVFDADRLTLPEMLQQKGYSTACIGKWHLGWDWSALLREGKRLQKKGNVASDFDWSRRIPDGPLAHGFDYYYGDDVPNFPPYTWIENDRVVTAPTEPYRPNPQPKEGAAEGRPGPMVAGWKQDAVMPRLTQKAVEWIADQKGKEQPFFLYFPWTSPHAPIVPAKDFQGSTKAGPYGDFVHQSDWSAGQVLKALDEHGFRDNTLVIFISDNGPERYAYERIRAVDHRSMGELRGLKRDIWEGGHRTPFLIRWPGVVKPERTSEALISHIDIMGTLAQIIGAKLPPAAAEDSFNQLPLLRGEAGGDAIRTSLVHNTRVDHYAVRENDWLLINARSGGITGVPAWFNEANGYKKNPHPAALYNLRSDPAQKTNLLTRFPAITASLRMRLATIRKTGHSAPRLATAAPYAAMGAMVGETTSTSTLVQVRLTKNENPGAGDIPGAAGEVRFLLRVLGEEKYVQDQWATAAADRDYIARAHFTNLKPGTEYECALQIGKNKDSLRPGPIVTFKTLPGADHAEAVRFVVVTGMNYAKFHGDKRIDLEQHKIENNTDLPAPYAGPDKRLGYPGLAAILALRPNFMIGTGDNVYYDTPDKPRAEELPELRRKWHEQFVQPRYRDLFSSTPTYWEIDDHDYRIDDGDNSGDYNPTPATGRRLMLEQLPVAPAADAEAKTYRTHRVSRDLQLWFVENRMYRSDNAAPDGPQKTIWGAEQSEWLRRTLKASDAQFKLLISPTPMIGPDDLRKTDNHCDVGGFQHERDAFFAWLLEEGLDQKHFYIVCGDRHWQYQSIHPSGIEEFSCGALVDANSRLGRKPGDPKSTDAQGQIKQPYYQTPRSGGFLEIAVRPSKKADAAKKSTLEFIWRDEHGKVLHRTAKR